MNRILIALLLSLVIHGLLISAKWGWRITPPHNSGKQQPLTLSLRTLPATEPQPEVQPESQDIEPPRKKERPQISPVVPEPQKETKSIEKIIPMDHELNLEKEIQTQPDTRAIERLKKLEMSEETISADVQEIGQPTSQKARPLDQLCKRPEYPLRAKKRNYEGTVLLDVLVKADGTVGDLKVQKSSGYKILDKAALKAVRSWKFVPAKRGLVSLQERVTVPVRFELQ